MITNRIDEKFKTLQEQDRKALILFMTAGDPNFRKNEELVSAFEKEGADFIEFGVPFSDPLADGPVIQAASQRALEKRVSLRKIFLLVEKIRKKSQIPILLMSYLNPILKYGYKRCAKRAKSAGVDGFIIPDLPPEEGIQIQSAMRRQGVHLVYLLAPTSDPSRQKMIGNRSSGFVYYVSLTGVTGARKTLPLDITKNLRSIKKVVRLPVCVGFGISKPSQAKFLSRFSDGVIIGSALVRYLEQHPRLQATVIAQRFVRPFARALREE